MKVFYILTISYTIPGAKGKMSDWDTIDVDEYISDKDLFELILGINLKKKNLTIDGSYSVLYYKVMKQLPEVEVEPTNN